MHVLKSFFHFQLNHLDIKQVTVPYVDHVSSVLLKTENAVQAGYPRDF